MHSLPSTFKGQTVARQAARRGRAGEERNHRCARSPWDRAFLWADWGLRQENAGGEIRAVVTALGRDRASALSHDIGLMVA
jgi:hypothetical protein